MGKTMKVFFTTIIILIISNTQAQPACEETGKDCQQFLYAGCLLGHCSQNCVPKYIDGYSCRSRCIAGVRLLLTSTWSDEPNLSREELEKEEKFALKNKNEPNRTFA